MLTLGLVATQSSQACKPMQLETESEKKNAADLITTSDWLYKH